MTEYSGSFISKNANDPGWCMGYEITTVGGLFEAKGVEPENGVTYTSVG